MLCSFSGHSIASQLGWEIDCKYLRQIHYEDNLVRCGPGCLWSDLIKVLNAHGKSPRTMQSYCSFSVGGTLAVNAHGITTDYCFAESVVEFRLARISRQGQVKVTVCRPNPAKGKKSLSGDLFSLALGGYGLFGLITEVVLKVADNVQLELDNMHLDVQPAANVHEDVASSEFVRIHDNTRNVNNAHDEDSLGLGKVEIKLARLNTLNLEKASFYVFRRSASSPTISDLPSEPRELSRMSRLLYKWAVPLLKDLRYTKEESSGKALDWSIDDGSTRNQLLFESAVPLSRLYNPIVSKDDTFVLQEFFCPHSKFSQWIEAAKPIYKEIEAQQKKFNHDLILLNTTIRYVELDDVTFLSYSRVPEGVFAFVLYYRMKRNEATEARLGDFHNRLAKVAVDLGGTFYLPYRKCYSLALLKTAYPRIQKFAELKESLDPGCTFSNLWFQHYILPLCSQEYRTKWAKKNLDESQNDIIPRAFSQPIFPGNDSGKGKYPSEAKFLDQLPRKDQKDLLRRNNSYRNLLRSKVLRDQFRTQFLVKIFNLSDPDEVMRVMGRAAWDPANKNDIHIYKYIHNHFHGSIANFSATLPRLWRGIQQLGRQKEELTKETLGVVSKLGMLGKIKNYVCMGDNGKTVLPFVKEIDISGRIWIVHDKVYPTDTLPPIEVVLERGSLDSVAHDEIAYDYVSDNAKDKLKIIETGSIDLVTMNQGLHHIPVEKLFGFLTEVKRILRPGGLFITREHDLQLLPKTTIGHSAGERELIGLDGKAPYPMLDLAHSVFNAVTGVSIRDETEEIRAFRPISEWRVMIESLGFEDSLVYDVEDGDPTWDEMMCFYKLPTMGTSANVLVRPPAHKEFDEKKMSKGIEEPAIIGLIDALLSQVPEFVASNASRLFEFVLTWLPNMQNKLTDMVLIAIPYLITQNEVFGSESRSIAKHFGDTFEAPITAFFKQIIGFMEGCLALRSQSELKAKLNMKQISNTNELYLIIPYFQRKVQVEGDDANELEKMLVSFVEQYIPAILPQKANAEREQEHDDLTEQSTRDKQIPSSVERNDSEDTVAPHEVQEVFKKIAETLPSILDSKLLLIQSGFTLPQQATLIQRFGGHNFPSTCAKVAAYLDRETWNEMKSNIHVAADSGDLPTKSRLLPVDFGKETASSNHPWHSVLMAFIKSPRVNLNQQALLGLRLIGLPEISKLYKRAKKEVYKKNAEPAMGSQYESATTSFLHSVKSSLQGINKEWADDYVERTITYSSDDKKEKYLWDVAEILQANFGYNSITSRTVDITKPLQIFHAQTHAKLANPEIKFSIPDNIQLGWLPIHEELLVEMCNKDNVGNALRKSLVRTVTLGTAGNNKLKIKYRRITSRDTRARSGESSTSNRRSAKIQGALSSGHFDTLKIKTEELCKFLESNGILRPDLHPNDGPYTWFKLNEWMQVEILEELVTSLEHTPWYRFPFLEFMVTYFSVFREQCAIVQEKYGFVAAYGSQSFLVDVVPGIVMTALFSQLRLLAIPLQIAFPNGYDKDRSKFQEDIVIYIPRNNQNIEDWDKYLRDTLDNRIVESRALPHDFMICSVPPFKAMGEIIRKFAIRFPSARIFQISNQPEVQVRISLDRSSTSEGSSVEADIKYKEQLQILLSVAGVKEKAHYQYPNTHRSNPSEAATNDKTKVFYCLEVHCLALLDVFRICETLSNFQVEQVYDFWN